MSDCVYIRAVTLLGFIDFSKWEYTKRLLPTENNWLDLIMEDFVVKSTEDFKEKC